MSGDLGQRSEPRQRAHRPHESGDAGLRQPDLESAPRGGSEAVASRRARTAIIPRWEWRTFGTRFGVAEERFAALESTGRQESDETYLLGGATGYE